VQTECKPENAVQGGSGGVMEQEAQRLFGQKKSASTGETANGNLNLQKTEGATAPVRVQTAPTVTVMHTFPLQKQQLLLVL